MTFAEVVSVILILGGVGFSMLAAVGMVRMPDFMTRCQASAKAGTLGVGCLVCAVAVWFGDFGVTVRAGLIVAFLLATAPVAAHLLSRAAYIRGAPLWPRTMRDDLRGQYDEASHTLAARRERLGRGRPDWLSDTLIDDAG